jgi:hypothetical protein
LQDDLIENAQKTLFFWFDEKSLKTSLKKLQSKQKVVL